MNPQTQQVLEEIQQIKFQYAQEVPRGRRSWPESLKSRVIRLCELGLNAKQIATESGLSYFTILNWLPREKRRTYRSKKTIDGTSGHFSPVRIRGEREIATVPVTKNTKPTAIPIATVTLTLPNGIRMEGVTPEFLRAWLGRGDSAWG